MSHNHVFGVHRDISRDEWQHIHDHAAGQYRSSEWSREVLLGVGKMRRKLFSQATGNVLDVACGYGGNFAYLTNATQLTATDFSPVMLEMAQQHAQKLGVKVALREADAEHLPFTNGEFDTVVSALATCSFFNPIIAMQEMKRVCKPKGRILLLEHGRSKWKWLARFQDRNAASQVESGGCRWNQETADLVRQAGLTILSDERAVAGVFRAMVIAP
jgi:ubiquinone/menaquinone biosynthesis C-methylase UbiE